MDKQEFLARLQEGLSGLPQEDITERLAFYSEMIDDRMEDGLTEEEAVAEIGAVDTIVPQIVEEIPITRIVRERVRPKRRLQTWEIVLLVLGSPIWISLLIAAFAVLLSIYIVIWALIVSLWAVEVSLIAGAVCSLAAGIVYVCLGMGMSGMLLISAGLILGGISVFLFFGCRAVTKGAVILTKKIAMGVKTLFIRKEIEK